MRAALPSLVLVAAAAVSVACGGAAFSCADASECEGAGVGGVCQPDGHCSFPDDRCPSGQRYGEHSGGVAGECVPETDATTTDDPESSSDTASTSSSTSADPSTSPLDATASAESDPGTSTIDPSVTDTASTGDTGPAMVDPDLLVWLPFEDADGTFSNEGVLGGEATCAGSECPEADGGAIGNAYTFDGVDDCLSFASKPELESMDQFTVASWIRLDAPGEHYAFVAKPVGDIYNNSFALYYHMEGDRLFDMFAVTDGDEGIAVYSPLGLPFDIWAHVAGTFDGNELTLWVDGQLVGTEASTLLAFDDQPLFIGCDDDHEPVLVGHAAAGIDDVRIYARVLTEDEIAEIAKP